MGLQLKLYKDESLSSSHLERLQEIFNLFKEDNPKFMSRQECLNLKQADNFVFVFSEFDGAAFNHVRSINGRYNLR
jgi:hypothetical protein